MGLSHLVAFEHDGAVKWTSDDFDDLSSVSIALADLDNDGDVEILADSHVFDHLGNHVFEIDEHLEYSATTAADLDDDGDLEVVLGASAYHHDGSLLWSTGLRAGYPQVANLDGDSDP